MEFPRFLSRPAQFCSFYTLHCPVRFFSFPALPVLSCSLARYRNERLQKLPWTKTSEQVASVKKNSAEWTKSWYFAEALLALALFVQFNYQLKVLSIPLTPELKTLTSPEHLTIPLAIVSCIAQQWQCLVMVMEMWILINGNGQIGVCSWLGAYLCCGCPSSDDLSPKPVPDAWCAFIMDFIGLIYQRSQWSQRPQDVHAIISRKLTKW